jgi:hypothetical protein
MGHDAQQARKPLDRRVVVADDPIHLYPQGVLPQGLDDLHVALFQPAQAGVVEQVAGQNHPIGANRVQEPEKVISSTIPRAQVQIADDDRMEIEHENRFHE